MRSGTHRERDKANNPAIAARSKRSMDIPNMVGVKSDDARGWFPSDRAGSEVGRGRGSRWLGVHVGPRGILILLLELEVPESGRLVDRRVGRAEDVKPSPSQET